MWNKGKLHQCGKHLAMHCHWIWPRWISAGSCVQDTITIRRGKYFLQLTDTALCDNKKDLKRRILHESGRSHVAPDARVVVNANGRMLTESVWANDPQ